MVVASATSAEASSCPGGCGAALASPGQGLIPVGPGSPGDRFAGEHYDIDADTGSSLNPGNWPEKVTAFLTSLCFGLVVFVMRLALAFVTFAFTFGLAEALADPAAEGARRLAEGAYARLVVAAVILAGLSAAWAGLVKRRVATTLSEIALALVLLGVSGVVLARPAWAIEGGFALARSLTAAVIEGVSPCPQGGCGEAVDASQVEPLTSGLWELFVRKPWFHLEFGKEFPEASPAYDVALQVLRTADPGERLSTIRERLAPLDPEAAAYAEHASISRLVLAMVLLGVGVLVGALLFVLAGTVVAAQLMAVALVVVSPLALLSGVVPGTGQRLFRRWAAALFSSLALVVAYGLLLAVVLVLSGAILDTAGRIGLLPAQGLEAILVLVLLRHRRALTSAALAGTAAGRGLRRASRVSEAARAEAERARRAVRGAAGATLRRARELRARPPEGRGGG